MALIVLAALFIVPGPFVTRLSAQAASQSAAQSALEFDRPVPLFPLPDVALFPNTTQPFHVFEPRYRELVADALAGDSIIGMVMLQPGFEADYEGRPPVVAIGCVGVIVGSELLPDGRYNLIVRGVSKFRILDEDQTRPYRLARVELLPEGVNAANRTLLTQRRRQIESSVLGLFPGARLPPAALRDEEAIDAISLALPMEPEARQALLEAVGAVDRAGALLRLLRPPTSAD
jgi:Lon protease-like protein